jgi:hypothetical protein
VQNILLLLMSSRFLNAKFSPMTLRARVGVIVAAAAFSIFPLAVAGATEDFHDLIRRQFEIYDPDYRAHHEHYGNRVTALARSLAQSQKAGRDLVCSQQMFLEAKWLHRYTAHWARLEDKLQRIEKSLDQHDQGFATHQSPTDGFWGICHEEWFMRLSATVDSLGILSDLGQHPRYRLRTKGQLDTGKKLLTRLSDLLISDIASTGVDNRGELSSLITSFSQGAFKPHLRGILVESIDLRSSSELDFLAEAFKFFLNGAQDPETGYWGAWYLVEGRIHRTADLSMTYHIIAYTKGRVEQWPRIIETTSAIEAEPYPYGWRHDGHYNNHNLYDVAKIYRFGWPYMAQSQRLETSRQLKSMLEWSLANTLEANGTFAADTTFSDSLADEYYFGISLLDALGYWQPEKRFWTDAPMGDDVAAMCCRLKSRLEQIDLTSWAVEGARRKLERNCNQC